MSRDAKKASPASPRIERLKERICSFKLAGGQEFLPVVREGADLCQYEWLCLWAEAMRTTSAVEPLPLRTAQIFDHILKHIAVVIQEDELIVGTYPKTRLRDLSAAEKATLAEAGKWLGQSQASHLFYHLPTRERKALDAGVLMGSRWRKSHICVDYGKSVALGLGGIRKEIEQRLAGIKAVSRSEDIEAVHLLRAMLIVYDAVSAYVNRYSAEAAKQAQLTPDPGRRAELEEISALCRRLSTEPPSSYHEGVQLVWFVHLLVQLEEGPQYLGVSPGRFDQYLYPLYRSDVAAGVIGHDRALELTECFWLKVYENLKLEGDAQHLSVGGQARDGQDATNDLSYLCLEATANLKLPLPNVSARVHKGSPERLLQNSCEMISRGIGWPNLFNDEVVIPALVRAGVSLEDARDYTIAGCVEIVIPGKTDQLHGLNFNNLKCLELALNNGRSLLTGKLEGLETGDITTYASFAELVTAYKKQVAYFFEDIARDANLFDQFHPTINVSLLTSSLVSDCIARGKADIGGGSQYNFVWVVTAGMVNVGDALAAIRKLVYEEKKIAPGDLQKALLADFKGYEPLRLQLLNGAPKYGNDDDYVDLLYKEIAEDFYSMVSSHQTFYGGKFIMQIQTNVINTWFGEICGASADGRKARTMLGDSSCPVHGRDRSGPTAAIKSLTKIDWTWAAGGQAVNLKFDPALFKDGKTLGAFVALLKTYLQRGGEQLQINVVSGATLRDARKNPERHRDLVVRVAGYSAHFILLPDFIQEDIISRTEYESLKGC